MAGDRKCKVCGKELGMFLHPAPDLCGSCVGKSAKERADLAQKIMKGQEKHLVEITKKQVELEEMITRQALIDRYAGHAMQGLLAADQYREWGCEFLPRKAFDLAEAMVEERERRKKR